MVHCVSSSEPDSGGDTQLNSEEWRGTVQTVASSGKVKEAQLGQPPSGGQSQTQMAGSQSQTQAQLTQQGQQQQPQTQPTKPTFVESSTVSSGMQVGSLVEQLAATGGTRQLTLTDTTTHQPYHHHELADTTHLDNTHLEPMDTSTTSPNHSIHSDTIVIAERISEELTSGDDYVINKTVVREQQRSLEPSFHIHQQQQSMLIDNIADIDTSVSNIFDPQQQATTIVQHEKFYSVGIAPGVYPHLYNFKADENEQQSLAVAVNIQEKLQLQQQTYFSPFVYDNSGLTNFVEGAVELEEESADSSDDDDEELWELERTLFEDLISYVV